MAKRGAQLFDAVAETRKTIHDCDVIGRYPHVTANKGACFRCVLDLAERAYRAGAASLKEDAPGEAWRRLRSKKR